jgi:superoxide dismutase, Fe-Mn family
MAFELNKLPYELSALAPLISKETLEYHYGKHHQGYVNKLNELIKNTEFEHYALEEIIQHAFQISANAVFNNAAQIWNHSFYWNCLTPKKNILLSSDLQKAIEKFFGSLESFIDLFKKNAMNNFGSGWTWLVKNITAPLSLEIINTSNANTPITSKQVPLLVCDVWEHAYYIDYRNARADYLNAFFKIIDWEFVSKNFEKNASS